MDVFEKKDLLFVDATYFVATFFCHYIFVNLKSSTSYMASILACHYKNYAVFLPQNKFFSVFLLPFSVHNFVITCLFL